MNQDVAFKRARWAVLQGQGLEAGFAELREGEVPAELAEELVSDFWRERERWMRKRGAIELVISAALFLGGWLCWTFLVPVGDPIVGRLGIAGLLLLPIYGTLLLGSSVARLVNGADMVGSVTDPPPGLRAFQAGLRVRKRGGRWQLG